MKMFKKWLIDKDNSKDILDLTNKPKPSKIDLFLKENDVDLKQGSISKCPELFKYFTKFLEKFEIKNVVEIGFLAGHISEYFLKKGCKVTSFDLGKFKSIPAGKRYIDIHYQNHELIKGDSKETLPKFIETNKEPVDFIIIDGAMDELTIEYDFENAMKLANEDTVIFANNVVKTPEYIKYWNTNFNKVYDKYINNGDIIELKEFQEESVGVGGVFCKFTRDL
jgi:predicted O-methyltransferase YrrM